MLCIGMNLQFWVIYKKRLEIHDAVDVPIEIVDETDEMLVVNKPPSIPVHPTGRYTHNSLVNILMHDHGYGTLHRTYFS